MSEMAFMDEIGGGGAKLLRFDGKAGNYVVRDSDIRSHRYLGCSSFLLAFTIRFTGFIHLVSPLDGDGWMDGVGQSKHLSASPSTGRFSDCNKLWHYHWLSLVQLAPPRTGWMRLELGELRATLAKLASISNNNPSDNAHAGDLKQHRQCYLFDLCLLSNRVRRILLGDGYASHPRGKNCLAGAPRRWSANFVESWWIISIKAPAS
jgi:hypothetical protein